MNAWQPAYDQFDLEVLPKLRQIGHQIGEDSAAGDVEATEVMRLYTMLHRSFDPMTMQLLVASLERYESNKARAKYEATTGG